MRAGGSPGEVKRLKYVSKEQQEGVELQDDRGHFDLQEEADKGLEEAKKQFALDPNGVKSVTRLSQEEQ